MINLVCTLLIKRYVIMANFNICYVIYTIIHVIETEIKTRINICLLGDDIIQFGILTS